MATHRAAFARGNIYQKSKRCPDKQVHQPATFNVLGSSGVEGHNTSPFVDSKELLPR